MAGSLWARLLGTEVRYVGDTHRTRLITAGTGEPLLLLHGQGGHAENFSHNIAALSRSFRVLAPDFWWHGLSDPSPEMSSDLIGDLVGQVSELLDLLEIDSAHVEGQSMGAWVAARLALSAPERVRTLVLTTAMGLHAAGDEPDADRMSRVGAAQLAALSNLDLDSIRNRMRGLFADPSALDDEIVGVRQQIYSDPRTNAALRRVAARYFDLPAMAESRVRPEDLARLDVPALVYWGSANPSPPDVGERLAASIPGCRWHCAEVGHWAQYERPEEHNATVLDFLEQHT